MSSLPSSFRVLALGVGRFVAIAWAVAACGGQVAGEGGAVDVDVAAAVDAAMPDAAADVQTAPDAQDSGKTDDSGADAAAVLPDAESDAQADADAAALADAQPDAATPTADAVDAQVAVDAADSATLAQVDADASGCATAADCAWPGAAEACKSLACKAGQCQVVSAADGSACEDGDACTTSDVCLGGQCAQGVQIDCDDGNPCTADGCKAGACSHSAVGGPCDDGNPCTVGDSCKGGACASGGPKDCADGNVCTDNSCNPGVGCVWLPNAASCTLLDLCQTGAQCGSGVCHAGAPTLCADGNPCTNDLCDPQTGECQFLVTTTPCDDGNACTTGDVCQAGSCQAAGQKSCDDGSACTTDSCLTDTGACVHMPADGSCDDGSPCTVNDACAGGVCIPGPATDCDDKNPCTDDGCDASSGCTHSENSQPCSVGDACELAKCMDGQCVTTGVNGCDDGNPCTVDTCVAPTGCVFTAQSDGATCSDATPCVGAGACLAGKCAPGAKTDCSDGNPCTDDHCSQDVLAGCFWLPNTLGCEDGNLCDGQDYCSNGKCLAGTTTGPATVCDDANTCTDDSCDPGVGCVHVTNSVACDDGNPCTIFETCASGVCQGGMLAACEDGNSCTIDVCAPTTGACSWLAKIGSCDDGNRCTTGDKCVGAACLGVLNVCDDANPCSLDACDPGSGLCAHTPVTALTPCDDADACTTNDTCAGLTCAGLAINPCTDGNACTLDLCDPLDATCSWPAASGACSDGNPCTVGDACSGGACLAGSGALCDDGNFCTIDQCNPATGACTFSAQADGVACDDGLACTAASGCKSGFCAPTSQNCTVFSDTFDCEAPVTGWSLPVVTDTNVIWAIDETPTIFGGAAHGCMLNYNNGSNYCGGPVGFYCTVAPTLVATSPTIDATDPRGMPRLAFDTWYQLDGPLPGGTGFGDGKTDVPLVVLRDVASQQILDQFLLSKSISACGGQCQSVWRSISLDEPKVAGHAFRIELSLASPSNWGNQGKGWFVDNVKATREFIKEICNNGIDDDGNGRVDCADPVCAGQPGC